MKRPITCSSTTNPAGGPSMFRPVCTDLLAMRFFGDPKQCDGGELLVEDHYRAHQVKLPKGHMVLYPGKSLHRAKSVTRGRRVFSFFWIRRMVREDAQRTLLFDLDPTVQHVGQDLAQHPSSIQLTGGYHNLLPQGAGL